MFDLASVVHQGCGGKQPRWYADTDCVVMRLATVSKSKISHDITNEREYTLPKALEKGLVVFDITQFTRLNAHTHVRRCHFSQPIVKEHYRSRAILRINERKSPMGVSERNVKCRRRYA
jgi:hypothetical protein